MGFGILRARQPQVLITEVPSFSWNLAHKALALLDGLTPWGVRREDGLIVYAKPTEPAPVPGEPYSRYDSNLNDRRKVMFESELAAAVEFADVAPALQRVNAGLVRYMDEWLDRDYDVALAVFQYVMKRALYDDKQTIFGRLGTSADAPADPLDVIAAGRTVMSGTAVPGILAIHQAFTKAFGPLPLGGVEAICHEFWAVRLTPASLFGRDSRGRESRFDPMGRQVTDPQVASTVGGITATDDPPVVATAQTHNRAINTWAPLRGRDASAFYVEAVADGLPYVAGPSGSTGELFRVAMTMGSLSGEEAKQYALACVAYLELGGNHSFHEIMTVAALAGVPYTPGEYEPSLPVAFKDTPRYQALCKKYTDVTVGILVRKLLPRL
jgi:hypothetical protein